MFWNPYYPNLNQIVNGTDGDDVFWLYRQAHTNVRTFDGDDDVELYGTATYNVDLGNGNDTAAVATTGAVDLDAGSGADTVLVSTMAEHDLEGGAGFDRLKFTGFEFPSYSLGLRIDVGAGTAENASYSDGNTISFSGFELIYGTDHHDIMVGDDQRNRLYGEDGNDSINGQGGHDIIVGGAGHDSLQGGDGDDIIYGNTGEDRIWGGNGDDRIYAGYGDRVYGGAGNDIIYANREDAGDVAYNWGLQVNDGAGDDVVYGNATREGKYIFSDGADTFHGSANASDHVIVHTDTDIDTFNGRGGDSTWEYLSDRLDYREADGRVDIDVQAGTVMGDGVGGVTQVTNGNTTTITLHQDHFSGFQSFIGSDFDDSFRGSDDADAIEWFTGQDGEDVFHGGIGEEHFNGGMHAVNHTQEQVDDGQYNEVSYRDFEGSVTVDLNLGTGEVRHTASGTTWDHSYVHIDGVVGTDKADTLIGNDGANSIEGGGGHDWLTGGEGADSFVFNGAGLYNGYDTVLDFDSEEDVIELIQMTRLDGQAINGFADLDTNGDGVLNHADTTMQTWMGDSLLMTGDGYINLMNVTELTADNFAFA